MQLGIRPAVVAVACAWFAPQASTQSVAVALNDPRAHPGLTTQIVPPGQGGTFQVFTMGGIVHHTWNPPVAGWTFAQLVKPLSGGRILGLIKQTGRNKKMLVELDWGGNVLWSFDPEPLGFDIHHDFQRLPNGNTLIMAAVPRTVAWFRSSVVVDDVLIVVDPSGAVVWSWSTLDNAAELPLTDVEWEYLRQLPTATVFHTNSVQSLPANRWQADDSRFRAGNLLVSQRETNLVYIIDYATGEVVWTYRGTVGQHHTRMIPGDLPGAGHILIMDNGGTAGAPPVKRAFSRAAEINPVTKREVWAYSCRPGGEFPCSTSIGTSFYTAFMGCCQRMPNGHTLITESVTGRVFEVTPAGELVWEYFGAPGTATYRAYRWPFRWRTADISQFYW